LTLFSFSRLTNIVDGVGTTTYTYATNGLLASEDGPFGSDTVTNFYSNRLRKGLSLAQPTGAWTNGFTYDAIERLSTVTSPAGPFDYYYPDSLPSRLVQGLVLPNTSYVTNTYDENARLTATILKNSAGTALDSALYGYNLGNQRTAFTNAAGTDVSYTYDPSPREIRCERRPFQDTPFYKVRSQIGTRQYYLMGQGQLKVANSTVSSEDRGYEYDAAWNLATRTNNGSATNFGVNNLNELSTVGSTSFYYDADGDLTNQSTSTFSTSYAYDDENRLASVQTGVGSLAKLTTFVYDGLGRLREQLQWTNSSGGGGDVEGGPGPLIGGGGSSWGLSGGIHYVYDGMRVIQERDISNNPTVSYTRGSDLSGSLEGAGGIGGLLARSDGYSSGNFTDHNFYHADGSGNITYLVNSSQTLAASYRYDPYGNLISSSGTLAATNTYRFSSKEFIPSAGLYYYLYRFYDPNSQRWLNRDPIEELGGINLFAFVANSPLDYADLLGLQPGTVPGNLLGTVLSALYGGLFGPTPPPPIFGLPPQPSPPSLDGLTLNDLKQGLVNTINSNPGVGYPAAGATAVAGLGLEYTITGTATIPPLSVPVCKWSNGGQLTAGGSFTGTQTGATATITSGITVGIPGLQGVYGQGNLSGTFSTPGEYSATISTGVLWQPTSNLGLQLIFQGIGGSGRNGVSGVAGVGIHGTF
jgi:RHS repeat-associated protein